MGRFQLESIYLYFPPSSQERNTNIIAGTTVENKGKLILSSVFFNRTYVNIKHQSELRLYTVFWSKRV
jgi:hypothetical protein